MITINQIENACNQISKRIPSECDIEADEERVLVMIRNGVDNEPSHECQVDAKFMRDEVIELLGTHNITCTTQWVDEWIDLTFKVKA